MDKLGEEEWKNEWESKLVINSFSNLKLCFLFLGFFLFSFPIFQVELFFLWNQSFSSLIFFFYPILFINRGIWSYKLSSKHCFYCVPQSSNQMFLLASIFKTFSNFPCDFVFGLWITLKSVVQFPKPLGSSQVLTLSLIPILIPLWSENIFCMISNFFNLFKGACGPECDISWWMFHVSLKRMYLLLLMDEVFHKCWFDNVDW